MDVLSDVITVMRTGQPRSASPSTPVTAPACDPRIPPAVDRYSSGNAGASDGPGTVTLCGAYELDPSRAHPLLLTWWRMTTAARLLREPDAPLGTIAARVGYTSEFAFAKAFKRRHGTAPGRYRRDDTGSPA